MMIPNLPRVCAIATGQEQALAATLAHMLSVDHDAAVRAGVTWLDDRTRAQDLYADAGGVALVSVRGVLVDRLAYHGADWATGYNGIRAAVAAAYANPEIKAVVLDIDSGGGLVAGCFELAEWLRATAVAEPDRPLVGIVTNWAASAAYAIASSCTTISAPRTGAVGSIGVLRMHIDMSKALEAKGVKVSLIAAGEHKTDGNSFEALPDAVREDWQAGVEEYRRMFAEAVSVGRGLSVDDVLATEARLYDGPNGMREALKLGLVDAVASPDEALQALLDHIEGSEK